MNASDAGGELDKICADMSDVDDSGIDWDYLDSIVEKSKLRIVVPAAVVQEYARQPIAEPAVEHSAPTPPSDTLHAGTKRKLAFTAYQPTWECPVCLGKLGTDEGIVPCVSTDCRPFAHMVCMACTANLPTQKNSSGVGQMPLCPTCRTPSEFVPLPTLANLELDTVAAGVLSMEQVKARSAQREKKPRHHAPDDGADAFVSEGLGLASAASALAQSAIALSSQSRVLEAQRVAIVAPRIPPWPNDPRAAAAAAAVAAAGNKRPFGGVFSRAYQSPVPVMDQYHHVEHAADQAVIDKRVQHAFESAMSLITVSAESFVLNKPKFHYTTDLPHWDELAIRRELSTWPRVRTADNNEAYYRRQSAYAKPLQGQLDVLFAGSGYHIKMAEYQTRTGKPMGKMAYLAFTLTQTETPKKTAAQPGSVDLIEV